MPNLVCLIYLILGTKQLYYESVWSCRGEGDKPQLMDAKKKRLYPTKKKFVIKIIQKTSLIS